MGGNISHLFNPLLHQTSQDHQKSQDAVASATFYIEPSCESRLLDLIKRQGTFRIKTTPAGYEVQLGHRRFTVMDSSEFIELSLHHADTLTEESSGITAELASILLPEPDKPIKLQASNINDERRLFQSVKKFFSAHPIRAFSEDQRIRFEFLEQQQRELQLGVRAQASQTSQNQLPKVLNLMGGFLKADEFGYLVSSIYVESDSIGFLMALSKEEGEITIEFSQEHFRFLLRGHVISLDEFNELSRVRLISPLSFGAADLMLRITEYLYQDSPESSEQTENSSSSLSESVPETSPKNPRFFSQFLNHPALLEQPENIIHPNNTFHPRNMNNPQNSLNPRSHYHPQHPRFPLKLSLEAHRQEEEHLLLEALNHPHLRATFTLEPKDASQSHRFQILTSSQPSSEQ
jgi:hypothetical protein